MKRVRNLLLGTSVCVVAMGSYFLMTDDSDDIAPSRQAQHAATQAASLPASKTSTPSMVNPGRLPEPPVEIAAAPAQLTLWNADLQVEDDGEFTTYTTRVDPEYLQQFQVGQQIRLSLPGGSQPFSAAIENTSNQGRFAKVWTASGQYDAAGSITITQGKVETHLAIVADGRVYSAIIDNASGKTVVIDEATLADKTVPYEDGVMPPTPPDLPAI